MTTAREKLAEALRRERSEPESKDSYWGRQKEAWLSEVKELCTLVKAWLQPLVDNELVIADDHVFAITEPDFGTYDSPGLTITMLGEVPKTVQLRPRGGRIQGVIVTEGPRVIGAKGRVDLESGPNREILLRFADASGSQWLSFAGGEKREVTEEVFFELLARVVDLPIV
jgi:hypothetical protein